MGTRSGCFGSTRRALADRGHPEWGTIPRLVQGSAERYAGNEALVDVEMGTRLTFAQLAAPSRLKYELRDRALARQSL